MERARKTHRYMGETIMPTAWQHSTGRWYLRNGITDESLCQQFATLAEARAEIRQRKAYEAAQSKGDTNAE